MGMCKWFLKMLSKFKMAAWGQLKKILWGGRTLELKVRNYSNFTITFPTICRWAGEFFKVLLKFKMAATDQLKFFGGPKNSKNLFGHFFWNFNITLLATWGCPSDSHSSWYADVQVNFSRFYLNSKWPPEINLNFLGGLKTKKKCSVNFFEILTSHY